MANTSTLSTRISSSAPWQPMSQRLSLESDLELFREKSVTICRFLAKNNISATPFTSAELPLFRALSADERGAVLECLTEWTDVLAAFPDFDISATELQVLWRTLQRAGFRFATDLFEHLTYDSVIEVYSRDNRQVFRSLRFFSVCSYTLEHVYSLPWFQLYSRDSSIEFASIELFNRLCRREQTGLAIRPFPPHEVRECLQGHSRTTKIVPALVAPLTNSAGDLTGFLNAFTVSSSVAN